MARLSFPILNLLYLLQHVLFLIFNIKRLINISMCDIFLYIFFMARLLFIFILQSVF